MGLCAVAFTFERGTGWGVWVQAGLGFSAGQLCIVDVCCVSFLGDETGPCFDQVMCYVLHVAVF